MAADRKAVGASLPRADADDKVRGRARYVDDLDLPGVWHGHVVRSPVAHGALRGINLDPAFDWSRVVVVTVEDIPGPNYFVMHDESMPVLAEKEILYLGEPIVLIAAPSARLAREAAAYVQPDIEELPAVLTLDEIVEQLKTGDPAFVQLSGQTISKGDVEKGFAEADRIVEGEYRTGYAEQLYLEPQGMVAIPEGDGGVLIEGSLQCPYYVVHELHQALNLPPERLRVRQAVVGGAFGGKEEFPSLIAGYCALLAMKARRPVKIVYDRHEDILFTTKRHPSWVRHKTGLKEDGTITAMKVDFLLNGGAYLTLSDVVMYRGILHAAMGYRCDHVFVDGRVGRTNTFPSGAFRGFGAPQAFWALETHVDKLAEACGMTPSAFRRRNGLAEGDTTPTGQVLRESVGTPAVLEEALKRAGFDEKLKRCSRGKPDEKRWYGIGVSFFCHGAGFTGDGEAKIGTSVALDLDRLSNGSPGVQVRVSSTEMGQGSSVVLCQMAADGLAIDPAHVTFPLPDTGLVPNSGPTVASRTTMVVGSTLFGAGAKMRKTLEAFASTAVFGGASAELADDVFVCQDGRSKSFEEIASLYLEEHGPLREYNEFTLPDHIQWNQETFEGDAYPAYSWACTVAEVEVDPLTLEIHLKRVTACCDVGTIINPVTAKGQLEGGLTQAFGYALMEKMGIRDGRFDADRLQTYVIPTMLDMPEFDLQFIEFPYEYAAPGAKGLGELALDGLAPAIGNAIYEATGVRCVDIPITPEMLLEKLDLKGKT